MLDCIGYAPPGLRFEDWTYQYPLLLFSFFFVLLVAVLLACFGARFGGAGPR
jgi:hypothetical protein